MNWLKQVFEDFGNTKKKSWILPQECIWEHVVRQYLKRISSAVLQGRRGCSNKSLVVSSGLGTPLQQPDIYWSSPIKDRTDTVTQDCTTLFRKQSDIVRRNSVFVDKIVNPAEKRFLTIKLNKWSYLAKDSLSPEQIVYCRFPLGEFLTLNTTQTIREETRSA